MRTPLAYGIDFGTSNSALAVALDDCSTEVLAVEDEDQLLASHIYLHRDSNRLAGSEAEQAFLITGSDRTRCRGCELVDWVDGQPLSNCRQARMGGFCLDSRLISQIKSSLSDDRLSQTHSWGIDFELEELVAVVLRQLKQAADFQLGADVGRVVLGHPVRFVGAEGPAFREAQERACKRLRGGAERAGFTDVVLVPESQAAIAVDDIDEGFIVCTDFGGGTFDAAIIDLSDDQASVLALDGVAVGGEEFDAKIFDGVVRPALGIDAEFRTADGKVRQLPAAVRSRLRSLSGLRTLLAHGTVASALAQFLDVEHDRKLTRLIGELVYGGQALAFYRTIEKAKIDLSTAEKSVIDFQRSWIDLHLPLTRERFEELIRADLARVRRCLLDACETASLAPEEVEFVTKTGGSSSIPAYDQILRLTFPNASIVERDPFTTVVSGLAEYAAGEWTDV